MDPRNPGSDKIFSRLERGESWSPLDWSPDDGKILALEYVSANETYLWIFDVSSGEKTLLTPKEGDELVFYGGGRFSKDGKGVYVTTDLNSEFKRLAYHSLAAERFKFLTDHISWDVDEFDLSPDGSMIAFVSNEDGVEVLHVLNTATGKEVSPPKLPIGLVSSVQWHNDGRHLGFNLSSARLAADVYSLDVAAGTVERWMYSEAGGLNTSEFPEPLFVRWKSFAAAIVSV
jgi:WD40 repeat protein